MSHFQVNTFSAEVSIQEASVRFNADENLMPDLDAAIQAVNQVATPIGGYVLFDQIQLDTDRIIIGDTTLKCGRPLCNLLKGSSRLAVLVCTLGESVSELYNSYTAQYDFVKAYLCDNVANIAIEKTMEQLKDTLRQQTAEDGLRITSHFCPGYCHWPIAEQHNLFALLPPEPCGIRLTSSSLMQPMKSISGIVGIGRQVTYKESNCSLCHLKKCIYRKQKIH